MSFTLNWRRFAVDVLAKDLPPRAESGITESHSVVLPQHAQTRTLLHFIFGY